MSYNNNSKGINYGVAKLDSNNNDWIPSYVDTFLTFKNIVSGKLSYYNVKNKIPYSYNVDLKTRTVSSNCYSNTYTDFCTVEAENLNYQSQSLGLLDIVVERGKALPYSNTTNLDSSMIKSAGDFFMITIGPIQFGINFKNYGSSPNQIFHQNINLNGVNYDSVFESVFINLSPNNVVPLGLYYSKPKGIIGYYLTDSLEIWLRN